jgi:hypothetical protein
VEDKGKTHDPLAMLGHTYPPTVYDVSVTPALVLAASLSTPKPVGHLPAKSVDHDDETHL